MINTDPGQAREQLKQILSDPEFGQNVDLEQMSRNDWFEGLQNASQALAIVEWIFYILIGTIIVALAVGLSFYGWLKRTRKKSGNPKSKPINHYKRLLAEIHKSVNNEDYQTALQKCFRLLLQKLAEQENLYFAKTKTNGEYRLNLRQHKPDIAKGFGILSEQFDRFWYGEQKIKAEDYFAFQKQVFTFLGEGKAGRDEKS